MEFGNLVVEPRSDLRRHAIIVLKPGSQQFETLKFHFLSSLPYHFPFQVLRSGAHGSKVDATIYPVDEGGGRRRHIHV